MTRDTLDLIEEVAKDHGLNFSKDKLRRYAGEVDKILGRSSEFCPSEPTDTPAEDIHETPDEFNSIRYSLSLPDKDGTLAGLDLGVKENIGVAGVPMTCGSEALFHVPKYHAIVVRRLIEAGGDICATTNMDEFAHSITGETSVHGPTKNPVAPGHISGGSSGGSSVGVAAGFFDAALGSDTGGSVRIPASYCGVIGLKPTYGTVPRSGFVDLAPSLDHIGILANSTTIAKEVFDIISGPDHQDPSTRWIQNQSRGLISNDIGNHNVAILDEAMDDATDKVEKEVNTGIEAIVSHGADVDHISIPTFLDSIFPQTVIEGVEFARLMSNNGYMYGVGTGYSEELRAVIDGLRFEELGEEIIEKVLVYQSLYQSKKRKKYIEAQRMRESFIKQLSNVFSKYDALVLPTTATTAPGCNTVTSDKEFLRVISHTAPLNLTGHPALSVPSGDVNGHPVGLQIVTDHHQETVALSIGKKIEEM